MQSQPPTGGNPWVAVRPGDDVAMLARRVSSAHQLFVERHAPAGRAPDGDGNSVRSVILDSWMRSTSKGVNPDGSARAVDLAAADLATYRASHPMSIIRPVVRKLLVEDAADSGLLIAISDEQGRLLWVEGDSSAKDRALAMNFVEGADWSEEHRRHQRAGHRAGTRSLRADLRCRAFQPRRARLELFGGARPRPHHRADPRGDRHHRWSAGRGAGGALADQGDRCGRRSGTATAPCCESPHPARRRRLLRLEVRARAGRHWFAGATGSRCRSGTPRSSCSWRSIRKGLSSDRLAVLLDENELDAVTIRAEMSRLRKVFGADRPRVRGPIGCSPN